ncbi:fimbrial protein [Salmonella enterica subsp. enterica serovar Okatie]|nr:fimbrial protein [Salmonella enterica subsp. enterica serovar Okatie]
MKNLNFFTVLSLSATLFSATTLAAGTSSVEMTFEAELTSTTCKAQIVDAQGTPTSVIDYGEVFKSEIANKSRVVKFSIHYSDCSGVSGIILDAKPGSGGTCSGVNADGNSYAAGKNAAFELWLGDVDRGTELLCSGSYDIFPWMPSKDNSDLPISSRIVVAKGFDIKDVNEGAVSAPITFVSTYK